jgi:hypothetical protein
MTTINDIIKKHLPISNKLNEKTNKLADKVYNCLKNIPEYKNLSMDMQGEIAAKVAKMIK